MTVCIRTDIQHTAACVFFQNLIIADLMIQTDRKRCVFPYTHTHVYTHIYTHVIYVIRIYIHTCMHTYMYAYIPA